MSIIAKTLFRTTNFLSRISLKSISSTNILPRIYQKDYFPKLSTTSLANTSRGFCSDATKSKDIDNSKDIRYSKEKKEFKEKDSAEKDSAEKRIVGKAIDYVEPTLETSLAYMESAAYYNVYGDEPIWKFYRRNFSGQYHPVKTRAKCVTNGKYSTGNPCPICRDQYLLLHHENIKLLEQLIDPITKEVLESKVIGLCRKQHRELLFQLDIARELGYIPIAIPHRIYDYSEYYGDKLSNSLPLIGSINMDEIEIPYARLTQPKPEEPIKRPSLPNLYWMVEGHKTRRVRKKKKSSI